jgi:hypothetical protein
MKTLIYSFEGISGSGADTIESDETYCGMPFFRKMTRNANELEICRRLQLHPHPNIVNIYRVGLNFVDMERVVPCHFLKQYNVYSVWKDMSRALRHMQTHGIYYIDWKYDNIGKSMDIRDDTFKLFDFDVSGIYEGDVKRWSHEPPHYFAYNMASAYYSEPRMIDNYAFYKGIIYRSD